MVFTLFLFVHLAGCFWFMLVSTEEDWVPPNYMGRDDIALYSASIWAQYTTSLYYATLLFLGVDSLPTNTMEVIYACVIIYLGAVVCAVLFGQMTVLTQTLGSKSARYNAAFDQVTQAMLSIKAPKDLQTQVTAYILATYWRRDQQEELREFFTTLSPSLRLSVCNRLYRDTLQHNLLLGAIPQCVDSLVRSLTPQLSKPEEVLIYFEDIGKEMYILVQGEVSIRCPTLQGEETHLRFLYPGEFFGEISLLTGGRRTATVVTANFCTLAVLNSDKFNEIMDFFPFLREKLLNYGVEKYQEEWKLSILQVLSQIPYFSTCSTSELTQIFYSLKPQQHESDSQLCEKGDKISHFYIIATGKVLISSQLRTDKYLDLMLLEPGSAVGFSSCLIEKKQHFRQKIVTDSCLLLLSEEKILGNFEI